MRPAALASQDVSICLDAEYYIALHTDYQQTRPLAW
jgi:hypothetical protein